MDPRIIHCECTTLNVLQIFVCVSGSVPGHQLCPSPIQKSYSNVMLFGRFAMFGIVMVSASMIIAMMS